MMSSLAKAVAKVKIDDSGILVPGTLDEAQTGTLQGRKLGPVGIELAEALQMLSLDLVSLIASYAGDLEARLQVAIAHSRYGLPATLIDDFKKDGREQVSLNLVVPVASKLYSDEQAIYSRQAQGFVITVLDNVIMNVVSYCLNLERLDIACGYQTARLLCRQNFQKLTHLGIDISYEDGFASEKFKVVAEGIAKFNKTLRSLSFERSASDAINCLSLFPQLQELTLFSLPQCRKDREQLSQHVALRVLRLVSMSEQEMGYMMSGERSCNVFTCLPPKLQTLSLERCSALPFTTEKFFNPPKALQVLEFRGCTVSDLDKTKIGENLAAKKFKGKVEFL